MAQLSLLQSLLGEKNPVAGWAGDNSNLLLGIGGSLLSRGMDFSNLPAYAALDTQAAQQKADAANTAQQKNATQEWLAKNYPQYSNLPIDQGWQLAMQLEGQKNSPRAMPDPIKLGAGETLFDPATGQPMFTAPAMDKPTDMPSAVREYQFAQSQGFAGSYADWVKQSKGTSGGMTPTVQKELFEAEDSVNSGKLVVDALDQAMALNDQAYEGPLAGVRGDTTALFGDQSGVATSRLKNLTTELALNQLKATFGAAPTEGERQILLQLQGSVDQPKAVRAAIFARAKEMAARRIQQNAQKAQALRSGEYFQPDYGAQSQAQPVQGDVTDILKKYGL